MATRAKRTQKPEPEGTSDELAAGMGVALAASAITNIVQAVHNTGLEQEKAKVIEVLRQWQGAASRLSAQLGDLRRAYQTLSAQVEELERQNSALAGDKFRLMAEADQLRRRVAELEAAGSKKKADAVVPASSRQA